MRLIDADALCDGRVENDPVVIAVKCAESVEVEQTKEFMAMARKCVAKEIEYLKEIMGLMDKLIGR